MNCLKTLILLVLISLFVGNVLPGQQAESNSAPETKAEAKKRKKAEKQAAKEAAREAREAADHVTVPISGWVSQTSGGNPDCVSFDQMAFHRDVVRGWGGLLNGGNNAFLGVSSTLAGQVRNTCPQESVVAIYADFYDSSGLKLGAASMQVLVPGAASTSFRLGWPCTDGIYYTPPGANSSVWIANCPASTARYSVIYSRQ